MRWRGLLSAVLAAGIAGAAAGEPPRVLVFSATDEFRHESIDAGTAALERLGREHGFVVEAGEDATVFAPETLRRFASVVFLNTTGDVLDGEQQAALEGFIRAGGGFVGVHAAADTEYGWPWYGELVGARFDGHPEIQRAAVRVVDAGHPATAHLDDPWHRTDEWYDFRAIRPDLRVLLELDEDSYRGATTGPPHPIAWVRQIDSGRAFYTGLGHTKASYVEPAFLQHLLGGLLWAMGTAATPTTAIGADDSAASGADGSPPPEEHFTKVILDDHLQEPMELTVLPSGDVLYIERKGAVKLYARADDSVTYVGHVDVFSPGPDAEVCAGCEDGLLGIAADPDFADNAWVYLYYSPAGPEPEQHLSRLAFRDRRLDMDSEVVLLEVPVQRDQCCHAAGSLAFDADGNLYLSTGDDVSPEDDWAVIDERPGRAVHDAQGTSANTDDLRGKILRIHPEPDGSYSIPPGNLFPPGTEGTRPEIWAMGLRNPFRLSVDARTGFVYWGDMGPDAGSDDPERGPRGYDEIDQGRAPGFYGWPYFIADNQPYRDYDHATGTPGAPFDPRAPVNDSPNNTGLRELPPARGALVWYPYARSTEFPMVSQSDADGRAAVAGPVFHADEHPRRPPALPGHYDGRLFIADWMRNWIRVVTLDADGDYVGMEPFLPSTEFHRPIDMEIAPDGTLYILEYGLAWYQRNEEAVLARIEYRPGRHGS